MLTTVSCSLNESIKGSFSGSDEESFLLDIVSPVETDVITSINSAVFPVTGTCKLVGKTIRVSGNGTNADDVLCQNNRTFESSLNFESPGTPDGTVTIGVRYLQVPTSVPTDSVTLQKLTQPTLYLVDGVTATEGSDLLVTVTLDRAGTVDLSFSWSTIDGTALSSDSDFTAVSLQSITLSAGVTVAQLTITTGNDTKYEYDEYLAITLSNGSDVSIGQGYGTATIVNDDVAPDIFISDFSGSEGNTFNFIVSLSEVSGREITFNYTSIDATASAGSDFTNLTGTASLAAGVAQITLSTPTAADNVYEVTETFLVSLSSIQEASVSSPGVDDVATGTINNSNAVPNIFVSDTSALEGTDQVFAITLSHLTETSLVFSWRTYDLTAGAADYTQQLTNFTQTLSPAGYSFSITVPTTADSNLEVDETFALSLTAVSGVVVATAGVDDYGVATIVNDDLGPDLFIDDLSISEGQTLSFQVSLAEVSGLDVVFTYLSYDGTALQGSGDYTQVTTTTATIPSGSLTTGVVQLAALNDNLDENSEVMTISLAVVSGAGTGDLIGQATIADINSPPNLFISDFSVNEPDTVSFVVSLSQASGKVITFDYSSVDIGSATGGGVDFNSISATAASIASGSLAVTVSGSVNAVDDLIFEGTETYQITLTSLVDVGVGRVGATVSILDNETPSHIFVGDTTSVEGVDLGFVVSLSGVTSGNVIFDFDTFDGTALSASDFTSQSRSYTISAGSFQITVPVVTGNDATYEADETMRVTLSNVSSNATIANAGVDNSATGTITNNDLAPDLFIDDLTFNEGSTGTFSVSLAAPSALQSVFTWLTFDGTALQANSDYTGVSLTTVTLAAGVVTSGAIQVVAPSDSLDENNETFSITLAVVSGAGTGNLSGIGTIVDQNSPPNIFITDASVNEGDTFQLIVSLDAISGLDVDFSFQSYDGTATTADSDYSAISGNQTIPALQGQITLFLVTTEDLVNEPNETVLVSLAGVNNASVASVGTDDLATGTINNDDSVPSIYLVDSIVSEGGTLVFMVSVTGLSATDITFNYQSYDGSASIADGDYSAAFGTLTIAPSTLSRSITIVSGDDTKLENNETFLLSLSSVSGANVLVAGTDEVATGTINNDDSAPFIYIADASHNEGVTSSHTVSLSESSGLDAVYSAVIYDIQTVTLDYNPIVSSNITIAAGVLTTSLSFNALADGLDENAETFLVSLTAVSNLQAGDLEATGTINDLDSPPDIFIDDLSLLEGDTGTVVISLSQVSGLDVSFVYQSFDTGSATGAGGDYADITSTTATIPAGSVTFGFSLTSIEDFTNEPDETFDISLSGFTNAGSGKVSSTITLQNDDGLPQLIVYPFAGAEGTSVNVIVSLSAISGLNVTFDWQTFDGTALQASGDYTAVSTTSVTILAGSQSLSLPVSALSDTLDEYDETFVVSISNAGNATIVGATANGTITDNNPTPSIYISDAADVNEGETLSFQITLSAISGRDVWFNWFTIDGTATQGTGDYTQITSTGFTIPAGTGTVSVSVVALTDAPLNEATEYLNVTLSAISNANAGDVLGAGNILDIDADPSIYINSITAIEGDTANLIISLSAVNALPVTASLTYTDGTAIAGSDYTNILSAVSIPAMVSVVTLTAWSDEDTLNEGTEVFNMTLSSLLNAQVGVVGSTFTITDDDAQPGIYISDAAPVTEGGTAQFVVSLAALSGLDVDFTYQSTDDTASAPGDYTAHGSTVVTIPAGALQTTLSVVTIDDILDDSANSEYFNVTLTAVTNGTISVANGVGQINDNDAPPTIHLNAAASSNEGETANLTITLSGASENNIDFDFNTFDGSAIANGDYGSQTISGAQIPAGSITFSFSVTLATDNIYEATENLGVTISSTTATSSGSTLGVLFNLVDTTGVPQLYTADASAVTEGATSNFVVTLSHLSDTEITFNWSTINGTATNEDTDTDYYKVVAQTTTITALSDTITLSVNTYDDVVAAEGTENYSITVSGGSANVTIIDGAGEGTINDNEGVLNLFVFGDSSVEGSDLVFQVSLSAVSGFNVTYSFNTFDGTALTADSDYSADSGTHTIPAGVTLQSVTVTTGSDTKLETDETMTLSLSGVVGAQIGVLGTDDVATGTITNDDGSPNLFIDDLALNEGETQGLVISLSEVSGLNAVFSWQTYDSTALQASGDYTSVASTQVTIPAGSLTLSGVNFVALADAIDEFDEVALVSLTAISGVSIVSAGVDDLGSVTIIDANSAPSIFIADISLTEPDTVDFVVSLSAVSGKNVWFDYASVDTGSASGGGTDYANFSASLITIVAGQINITISSANAVDDILYEGNETYQITLTNINNAGVGQSGSQVTIYDSESIPNIYIFADNRTEGNPIDGVVSLSGLSASEVTFDLRTYFTGINPASDADMVTIAGNFTIPASEIAITISVTTIDDPYYEWNEEFTLSLSSVSGANVQVVGTDDNEWARIVNNDSPPEFFIDDFNLAEGTTGSFVITVSAIAKREIDYSWTTYGIFDASEGVDYVANSGTTILPADTLAMTLPIVALGDLLDESNEQFLISLGAITYIGAPGGDWEGVGTIIDDDGAPNLFIGDVTITEGGSAQLLVTLSAVSGQTVYFDFYSEEVSALTPGDFTAIGSMNQSIPAGQITYLTSYLVTTEDTLFENTELMRVSLMNISLAGIGDDTADVTILDNDPMPILFMPNVSEVEGSTLEFVISLSEVSSVDSTFTWQSYDGASGAVTLNAQVADIDYTATSGIGTIAAGALAFTIPVISNLDSKFEADEQFLLSLSSLGNVSVVSAGDEVGAGTISNDDSVPALWVTSLSLNEGETVAAVISISAISGLDVAFDVETVSIINATLSAISDTDFTSISTSTHTIAAGALTVSTVLVDGYSDLFDEFDEQYSLSLSGPINATLASSVGTIEIVDQTATPNLFIDDLTITEGDTGYMVVSLDGASGKEISFSYQTYDNTALAASDYSQVTTTVVTIPAGAVTVGLELITTEDALTESTENFYVSLSSASNVNVSDDIGIASIQDDDLAEIYIADASLVLEGQTAEFIVSISGPTASNVTFDWMTYDGTADSNTISGQVNGDFHATISSGVIPAGATQITLAVPALDDPMVELAVENFTVSLYNNSGNTTIVDGLGLGAITSTDTHPADIRYTAVLRNGSLVAASTNGSAWTFQPLPIVIGSISTATTNSTIEYCNGNWAVSGDGDVIAYSSDFTNWSTATVTGSTDSFNLKCHKNRWFASDPSDGAFYSDDLLTWTASTIPVGFQVDYEMEFHKDRVYIVGKDGMVVYSDDNGANYNFAISLATTTDFNAIAAEGDRVIALSAEGQTFNYYTDDDFTTINEITLSSGSNAADFAFLMNSRLMYPTSSNVGAYTDDLVNYTTSVQALVHGAVTGNGNLIGRDFGGTVKIGPTSTMAISNVGDLSPGGGSNHQIRLDYGGPTIEPDLFSIPTVTDLGLNVTITSATVTISGMTAYQGVYASGGAEANVDGGGWVSGWGVASVTAGSELQLRMTAASTVNTEKSTTLRIGNRRLEWTTVTQQQQADIFIADAEAIEGENLEFIVSLSVTLSSNLTFYYSTIDSTATSSDSDYTVASLVGATIPAGQSQITISVATTVDTNYEGLEDLTVSLSSVSSNGNVLDDQAVGYILNDDCPTTGWCQQAYLKASNAASTAGFGENIYIKGDTILVGAQYENSDGTSILSGDNAVFNELSADSGAVYMFERSNSTWSQVAYFKSANSGAADSYGHSVAMSETGIVAISAIFEDGPDAFITNGTGTAGNGITNSGAVYVYEKSGGSWVQTAYIKPTNNLSGVTSNFGDFLRIDNNTLVVGGRSNYSAQTTVTNGSSTPTDNGSSNSGAAYVFEKSNGTWSQTAFLKASNNTSGDRFGVSVGISGNLIVVGANEEDSVETFVTNGASGGGADNTSSKSGAAYIYEKTGGTWGQVAFLKASNSKASDEFGRSVAIDGETVVVGSFHENSSTQTVINNAAAATNSGASWSGAAYVYSRVNGTWVETAYFKSSNSGSTDYFGSSVDISGDVIVVGATNEDSGYSYNMVNIPTSGTLASSVSNSGAAYVFTRTNGTWYQSAALKATNPRSSNYFGESVSIDGDTIVVGSSDESSNQNFITNGAYSSIDDSMTDSGATYVYKYTGSPQVYIKQAAIQEDPTSILPITWDVEFSKPINDGSFDVSDITLDAAATASGVVFAISNSGDDRHYTLTATAVTVAGVVKPEIAAGVVTDTDGNSNLENSETFDHEVTYSSPIDLVIYDSEVVEGETAFVLVSLASSPTVELSFEYSTYDGTGTTADSDYTSASSVAVTFAIGQSQVTIAVASIVDTAYEGLETFNVSLSNASASLNVLDDQALVYIHNDDCPTEGWCQQAYIKPSNLDDNDYFGREAIALDGDRMLVGAFSESSSQSVVTNGSTASANNSRVSSGAAYIFERSNSSWSQVAYLKASNRDSSDNFGIAVGLKDNLAIVGAYRENSLQTSITEGGTASSDNSGTYVGAAYVFEKTSGTWGQTAYLKASNAENNDNFGGSIAYDGGVVVVSAGEDSNQTTVTNGSGASSNNSASGAGAVYLFEKSGGTWAQVAYLKAANAGASDSFGSSLSIKDKVIVIGVENEDSIQTTVSNDGTALMNDGAADSGAAYVFEKVSGSWVQTAYLKSSNSEAGDNFGKSVDIDRDIIVVGANGEDSNQTTISNDGTASSNNSSSISGAAYVFIRSNGTWQQSAYLKPTNSETLDSFGVWVGVSGDRIAVGATGEDSDQSFASNDGSASSDNSSSGSGAVYIFERTNSTWAQKAFIKASNAPLGGAFGQNLDLQGDTLAVYSNSDKSLQNSITNGAYASIDQSASATPGVVHVFKYTGSPQVIIKQAASQEDPASTLPITWDVEFSKPINDGTFDVSDITLDAAATASGVVFSISNSGDDRHYTLTASAVTVAGVVKPEIAAGVVTDTDGFTNLENSESFDHSVTYNGFPEIFVPNQSVAEGQTVQFAVTLSSAAGTDVEFDYVLYDGTATASASSESLTDGTWFSSVSLSEFFDAEGTLGSTPGGGATITGISGYGVTITDSNATVEYVDGVIGTAISLDGTEDYLSTTSNGSVMVNGETELTVMSWVYLDSNSSTNDLALVVKGSDDVTNIAYLLGYKTGTNVYNFRINTGGTLRNLDVGPVTYDKWLHLAGVFGNGSMRLYVDGVLLGQAGYSGNIHDQSSYPLYIGKRAGSGRYYMGAFDELAILKRAVTQQELQDIYWRKIGGVGDYIAGSGHLTIPTSSTGLTIPVVTNDDSYSESTEFFTLSLTNITNAASTITGGQADVLDNDTVENLYISDAASVNEGETAQFVVSLSAAVNSSVYFQWAPFDETAQLKWGEYSGDAGVSEIPAGQLNVTLSVPTYLVPIAGVDKTFVVSISNATSNVNVADDMGRVTIIEGDIINATQILATEVVYGVENLVIFTENLTDFYYVPIEQYTDVAQSFDQSTYCDGRWLITDNSSSKALLTTDFINFQSVTITGLSTPSNVKCFDGRWLTGDSTTSYYYSDDGITWNSSSDSGNVNRTAMGITKYRGDIYLSNYAVLKTSSDNGATFINSITISGASNTNGGVYAENDIMIAAGGHDTDMYISQDFFATVSITNLGGSIGAVHGEYFLGRFHVVNSNAGINAYWSDDLNTFTATTESVAIYPRHFSRLEDRFWYTASNADGVLFQSVDNGVSMTPLVTFAYNITSVGEFDYGGPAIDPGTMTFADATGAELGATITSGSITIPASMTAYQKVFAGNGAEVRVNGGSWTAGDGTSTITGSQILELRMAAHASNYEKDKTSTVFVGPQRTEWTVRTKAESADVTLADAVGVIEGGTLEFVVSLSAALSSGLTFNYSTYDGAATTVDSDYTPASSVAMSIPAGQSQITISVTTTVDTDYEGLEDLTVSLSSVSSNGNVLDDQAIGYILNDDCPATGWCHQAYIKPSNAIAGMAFGRSVDSDGDQLIVGAPDESSSQTTVTNGATASTDTSSSGSGAAYIFSRTNNSWAQSAYLKATNNGGGDQFGWRVAIDGNYAAVGAWSEDSSQTSITQGSSASSNNSSSASGAIYIFEKTGGTWGQTAYIKTSNQDADDQFGGSKFLLNGPMLIAGVQEEDSSQTTITHGSSASSDNSSTNNGAVYVFEKTGGSWVQSAYIKQTNWGSGDYFGASISYSQGILAVGSALEDSNQTTVTNSSTASTNNSNTDSGAVYLYERVKGSWSQVAYLKASNNDSADQFGYDVAIDGETVVVGATGEDSVDNTITNGGTASSDNSRSLSGAAYIFERTSGTWGQTAYLKAMRPGGGDNFGTSVDIFGDKVVVGANLEDGGADYILNGPQPSLDNSLTDSGGVYVFERTAGTWAQSAFIKPPNPSANDEFGNDVKIVGDSIYVGVKNEDSNQQSISNNASVAINDSASGAGAVYVFKYTGSPQVIIKQSESQADPTTSLPISWDIEFSKKISDGTFDVSDITLDVASTASGVVFAISNSGDDRHYTLTATSVTVAGVVKPEISAGVVSDTDGFTNLESSETFDHSVTYEPMKLFVSDAIVNEGDLLPFTIYFDRPLEFAVTLSYSVGSGGTATENLDYESFAGTTILNAGRQAFQVLVNTIEDTTSESDEYLFVEVTLTGDVEVIDDTGRGTILDDDETVPGLQIFDALAEEGNALQFLVTLQFTSGSEITFNMATSDGTAVAASDYTATASQLMTIPAGASQITISIPTTEDALDENMEYMTVVLSSLSGADPVNIVGTGVISDDDPVNSSVTIFISDSGSEEGEVMIFDVTLTESFTSDIVIPYSLVSGTATEESDFYVDTSKFITISSGKTNSSIYVNIVDDGLLESSETFTVSLTGTTDGVLGDALATGTITNSPYRCPSEGWCQQAYFKPTLGAVSGEYFGYSIGLSGQSLFVGAYGDDSAAVTIAYGNSVGSADDTLAGSGAAYAYLRSGDTWQQEAFVKASKGLSFYYFAYSLDINGNTAVVGAYGDNSGSQSIINGASASADATGDYRGAAYVYRNNGSSWYQEAYLQASNGDDYDVYGKNVSVFEDTVAVAAFSEQSVQTTITNGTGASTNNDGSNVGAVYIYQRSNSTWYQQAYVKASNAGTGDNFGTGLDLDRDTLVVSAPDEDSGQTGITNGAGTDTTNTANASGAAYIYRRQNSTWYQEAFVKANNAESSDYFGHSIAIHGDTVAIGASRESSSGTSIINGTGTNSDNLASWAGAVYVYKRNNGTWTQEAYLKAPNAYNNFQFGKSLDLQADKLVVGSQGEGSSSTYITNGSVAPIESVHSYAGASYVFERTGSTWAQTAHIKPFNNLGNSMNFGWVVKLDGDSIAVGASSEDSASDWGVTNGGQASADTSSSNVGAVYVYYNRGYPSVYLRAAKGQSSPATSLPIEWEVVFSKEISDVTFDTSDISLDGSSTGSGVSWNLVNSGDNRHYTLQALTVTSGGTLIPEIAAGVVFDLDGFSNKASSENVDATVDYNDDPCSGTTLGGTCSGTTAIYAGSYGGNKYMITPRGCTDSSTPTCAGGADSTNKYFNGTTGTNIDITGVETVASVGTASTVLGDVNTTNGVADASVSSDSGLDYCNDMDYGGYTDWYLPSKSEMAYLYCKANNGHNASYPDEDPNCTGFGGKEYILSFSDAIYLTSTEVDFANVHKQSFWEGAQYSDGKASGPNPVRCVRRY